MSSLPVPDVLKEQLDEVARVTEGCHSELQRLTWPVDPSLMETCAQASAPSRDAIERLLDRLDSLPSEDWATDSVQSTAKVGAAAAPARVPVTRPRPRARPAGSRSGLAVGSRRQTHWPRYAIGGLLGAAAAVLLLLPRLGTELPDSDIQLGSSHQLSSAVPARVGPSIELSGDGLIQLDHYDKDGVELELVSGSLHARVDPEGPMRELTVQAGLFSVEVQGTEFDVERRGGTLSVDVQEGRVLVRERGQEDLVLGAGQSLRVDPSGAREPRSSLAEGGVDSAHCEEEDSAQAQGAPGAARPAAVAALDPSGSSASAGAPRAASAPAGDAAGAAPPASSSESAPGGAGAPGAGLAPSSGRVGMSPAGQGSAPGAAGTRPMPSEGPEGMGASPDRKPGVGGEAAPSPAGQRGVAGGAGSERLDPPYELAQPVEDGGYGFCPAPPPQSKASSRSERPAAPRAPVQPPVAGPSKPMAPTLPQLERPEPPAGPSKATAPAPREAPAAGVLPPALAAAQAEVVSEPLAEKTRWPEGVLPPSEKEELTSSESPSSERALTADEEAWLGELEGAEDETDSSCAPLER